MLVKQLIISKLDYCNAFLDKSLFLVASNGINRNLPKKTYCNALYINLSKTRVKKPQFVLNLGTWFIHDIYDRNIDLIPF